MPILERDPWRTQYFDGIPCPDDVIIPTDDADAWYLHPDARHIYDKLFICRSQGLAHGPHGVMPGEFPVFSKPIVNLRGMGAGSRLITNAAEYEDCHTPGHLWMPLLTGAHVSHDVAVIQGQAVWWRHTIGYAADEGTFDYWHVESARRPDLEASLAAWIGRALPGHHGLINLETIGGTIIEAHLRFADQFVDLYGGRPFVEAAIGLYANGHWQLNDNARDGFSVVLFGPHGRRYRAPPAAAQTALVRRYGLSSLQITFHQDKPAERHAMPPGGFRLAILNGFDLEAAKSARQELARWFGLTPENT